MRRLQERTRGAFQAHRDRGQGDGSSVPRPTSTTSTSSKVKHIREFLGEGNKAVGHPVPRPRDRASGGGTVRLAAGCRGMSDIGQAEQHPIMEGRRMLMIIGPKGAASSKLRALGASARAVTGSRPCAGNRPVAAAAPSPNAAAASTRCRTGRAPAPIAAASTTDKLWAG